VQQTAGRDSGPAPAGSSYSAATSDWGVHDARARFLNAAAGRSDNQQFSQHPISSEQTGTAAAGSCQIIAFGSDSANASISAGSDRRASSDARASPAAAVGRGRDAGSAAAV
jgi:hypothetical protein